MVYVRALTYTDLHVIKRAGKWSIVFSVALTLTKTNLTICKALIKVLGFYHSFSNKFDKYMKLTYNLRKYRPIK